ncbi:23S rRNA (pseudouridine(1915)-N(3))-methyltransferase RlmH [Calderihabitans maritimus]|uniref:Ribosomal RNA large subunit methyltransferase H n=1 Tax=Calderihabitans maritimus TaxID=1246530 RepID=A0A1Z5HW50_9FIRM|nr:23S rRNA (pseudouridine(1915)-N(3))-methyltransferase RlmH [Calderihabitans maritimus]GAW93762.1 hypothetical protein KKC1_28900 [Calderihabitans maritimus]
MHVLIIAVGKLREKYLQQGVREYAKRLKPYARLEIIEVPEEKVSEKVSPAEKRQALEREAEKVLRYLPDKSHMIVLDIQGKLLSSEEFSRYLEDLSLRGQSNIAFVVGGPLGLDPKLISRADFRLSFSPMTFPHQLARLILLEQIYRAFKILRNEPYHK